MNTSEQPVRYIANGNYGEGQELLGLQQSANMAGKPSVAAAPTAADAEAILAIVQPVIDEQINAIIAMIADLRNHMEEVMSEGEEVVEVEATKLTQHDKFSMVSKFLNNN